MQPLVNSMIQLGDQLNRDDMYNVDSVIHLPACPASEMHKFPKTCTNLVLHLSIWTQTIITILIRAYVLASNKMQRYRSA